MDKPDLAAIEHRWELTLAGPWLPSAGNNDGVVYADRPWGRQVIAVCQGSEAAAEAIAHARDDIPALCAYARQLEAERDAAQQRADLAEAIVAQNGITWYEPPAAHIARLEAQVATLRTALERIAQMAVPGGVLAEAREVARAALAEV